MNREDRSEQLPMAGPPVFVGNADSRTLVREIREPMHSSQQRADSRLAYSLLAETEKRVYIVSRQKGRYVENYDSADVGRNHVQTRWKGGRSLGSEFGATLATYAEKGAPANRAGGFDIRSARRWRRHTGAETHARGWGRVDGERFCHEIGN